MVIDYLKLKGSVSDSNKENRVMPYMGKVLLYLCKTKVGKSNLKDKDEHTSEVVMIAMEKSMRYLKTVGKMKTKGMLPRQVMQYLVNLVHFSFVEHQNFVYGQDKRILKGKEIEFVALTDKMDGFYADYPDFDERIDLEKEIDYELSFAITGTADESIFNGIGG